MPILLRCFRALPALMLAACALTVTPARRESERLAGLMVERLSWMDEVAEVKQARSLPVTDPVREAELLRAMEQRGAAAGIPAVATRAFFIGQITAAKRFQAAWMQQQQQQPTVAAPPDLAKTVRPELDRIGAEMITSLARLRASGAEPSSVVETARERLTKAGYAPPMADSALDGLSKALQP